jgi:hypothetical protein
MVDPFSIISVRETGANVAAKVTQMIKDPASAPDELLALSNEFWNIKLVLDDLRELQKTDAIESEEKLPVVEELVSQSKTKAWGKFWQAQVTFSGPLALFRAPR